MKAVICAAGVGSRLGLGIPKALVEVGGRRIIEWQLEALRDYDVTVVAGFRSRELSALIGGRAKVIVSDDYENSSICHSIGLVDSDEPHLIVDGDVIFRRQTFPSLPFVGVCYPRSDEPVYVVAERGWVSGFTSRPTGLEWACIFVGHPRSFQGRTGHAYQTIAMGLPLPAVAVDCFEVDTKDDLAEAERWIVARR